MASSTKAMEMFPDLHHKMSKKIAQLTKVIYHLNTKNEDHQTEMEIAAANNQLEIQQILKDAASRISKFKEAMETRQSSLNQDVRLEKLQKKHEQEKQAALQEFNSYKAKVTEREQKISGEFQKKFESVRKEVEAMNVKFQERISAFEVKNQDLKRALDSTSLNGVAGLEDMRKHHEAEIADLVRTGNEKFQAMLLEKLQQYELLKREMEDRLSQQKRELTEKFRQDLDQEVGQVRAKLGGDKQEALLSLRRELEDKMTVQKAELTAKMEKLLADLRAKNEECDRISATKNAEIEELRRNLTVMQQSLNDQLGGQEAKVGTMTKELMELKNKAMNLQAKLGEREDEIEILKKMMTEKSGIIAKLERDLATSDAEVARLRKEIEQANQSGASSQQQLQSKLTAAERDAASLRSEINQMGSMLANVRDELKKAEKNAQKAAQDAEKVQQALLVDKEMLQQRVQDLMRSSGAATESAAMELLALQKRMADKETEMLQDRELLQNGHNKTLSTLKEAHRAALEAQTAAAALTAERAAQRESDLSADFAARRAQYETKIEEMLREHQRVSAETTERHTTEVTTLKSSLSAVEGQLQLLSEQADAERTALKAEVTKIDAKYKALQKELDARKKDGERSESVMTGLKNQIESLREELKASQKAFRDKMDMSKAKLEAEWQERLDAQVLAGEQALAKAQADAQRLLGDEMSRVVAAHEEEVRTLKQILREEAARAANEQARVERANQDLEAELKAEKAARAAQVADLTARHTAATRSMEEAYKQEMERIRRELTGSAEARETSLLASHTAEITRLNRMAEVASADHAAALAAALQNAAASADAALKQALAALEARMLKEKANELQHQSQVHANEAAELKARYEHDKSLINAELASIKAQLADTGRDLAAIQKQVAEERVDRQRREEAFILERDQIRREHEADLRKERENSERRVVDVMERAQADLSILKQEQMDVRTRYDERLREMQKEYKALELRFMNRESRSEDLDRIRELELEMLEKDELVAKTKEEMLYFKREMLNREENYNQKFNAAPNVGVMQVLKPKINEPPAAPAGIMGGNRKPTQMRLVNPNGGAMMMPPIGASNSGLGISSSNLPGGSSKKM